MSTDKIQAEVYKKDSMIWVPAKPLQFVYPLWIRKIPIKFLRDKLKKWYWERE